MGKPIAGKHLKGLAVDAQDRVKGLVKTRKPLAAIAGDSRRKATDREAAKAKIKTIDQQIQAIFEEPSQEAAVGPAAAAAPSAGPVAASQDAAVGQAAVIGPAAAAMPAAVANEEGEISDEKFPTKFSENIQQLLNYRIANSRNLGDDRYIEHFLEALKSVASISLAPRGSDRRPIIINMQERTITTYDPNFCLSIFDLFSMGLVELPDLPVYLEYVQACSGDVPLEDEWEDLVAVGFTEGFAISDKIRIVSNIGNGEESDNQVTKQHIWESDGNNSFTVREEHCVEKSKLAVGTTVVFFIAASRRDLVELLPVLPDVDAYLDSGNNITKLGATLKSRAAMAIMEKIGDASRFDFVQPWGPSDHRSAVPKGYC